MREMRLFIYAKRNVYLFRATIDTLETGLYVGIEFHIWNELLRTTSLMFYWNYGIIYEDV